MTGENRSTREKTCLSSIWSGLAIKPDLRGEGSATKKLGLFIFMVFIIT